MENASKALIIAGAILLSILIISLGIMIFGQASGVVDNNSMTELEITTFNEKFSQYFGTKVRGANAIALINAVEANNRVTDDDSKNISFAEGSVGKSAIETGSTYNITATAYTTGGLIHTIKITKNNS